MTGRFPALTALALLLPASAAFAQDVPPGVERDLWCGLAFVIIAGEAPGDATDEQKALARSYAEGGTMLADGARAAYLESGMPPERLDAMVEALRTEVAAQVDTAGTAPRFSFEECRVLLPF